MKLYLASDISVFQALTSSVLGDGGRFSCADCINGSNRAVIKGN